MARQPIARRVGRSAAGGVTRAGSDRMVAEDCLGKVGAVAVREVSRFAHNSRNWQQLIEMCRVADTVLIDQDRRRSSDVRPSHCREAATHGVLQGAAFMVVENLVGRGLPHIPWRSSQLPSRG